jgi:riboflavin biosynthesis pyrimidine reductase
MAANIGDQMVTCLARKDAGMQMVVGERPGPLVADELPAVYPWPAGQPWLRSMMVMTLDGAATGADGRSRSISSPTDRAVLATTRRFSDVVLIGAGTFRTERYGPMRARPEDADQRAADGQAPAPVLAIASASLDLPWEEPAFAESEVRPIVLTLAAADPTRLAVAARHAHVIALQALDARAVVTALRNEGLPRIVCEGGPRLLSDLVRLDLVDEADLTLAPLMTGAVRLVAGPGRPVSSDFALAQVIVDDDGFIYTRYLRVHRDGTQNGGGAG